MPFSPSLSKPLLKEHLKMLLYIVYLTLHTLQGDVLHPPELSHSMILRARDLVCDLLASGHSKELD